MLANTSRFFAVAIGVLLSVTSPANADDVIQQWNRVLSDVLKADTTLQNPGMASRSLAMTNIAMYDAINCIDSTHQTMYSYEVAPTNALPQAAALQAGYRVLSEIYPGQQAILDSGRDSILSTLPSGTATDAGLSFGDSIGSQVVEARENDGFDNMVPYMPTNEIGHWQADPLNPTQMAWGPEWGQIKPFSIGDTMSMMPPEMPSLTSDEYTQAFNEVKELGGIDSTARTADQTEAGIFWAYDRLGMGTPMRLYLDVLDTVATDQGNSFKENARLYAMASTALADAGIVAWDAKFTYDFWRPVTGIREADNDGNPNTLADPDWVPLGAPGGVAPDGSPIPDFTPPFPTYVSGHASFGGALFRTLTDFYGTDEISLTLTSEELPGVEREFATLSEAMAENGRSRVYLGIHWDFDDFMARDLGGEVGEYVMKNEFQPIPEPSGSLLISIAGLFLFGLRPRRFHRTRC